jgi:hypothetical protein
MNREIYQKLVNQIQKDIDTPKIVHTFTFTIEEMQDDYACFERIATFLDGHRNQYKDFSITSRIDSDTMYYKVIVTLYLTEEWRNFIFSSQSKQLVNYFEQKLKETYERQDS